MSAMFISIHSGVISTKPIIVRCKSARVPLPTAWLFFDEGMLFQGSVREGEEENAETQKMLALTNRPWLGPHPGNETFESAVFRVSETRNLKTAQMLEIWNKKSRKCWKKLSRSTERETVNISLTDEEVGLKRLSTDSASPAEFY